MIGGFCRAGTAFGPITCFDSCFCGEFDEAVPALILVEHTEEEEEEEGTGTFGKLRIDCNTARLRAAYWEDLTTSLCMSMTMCVNGRDCSLVLQYSDITCTNKNEENYLINFTSIFSMALLKIN